MSELLYADDATTFLALASKLASVSVVQRAEYAPGCRWRAAPEALEVARPCLPCLPIGVQVQTSTSLQYLEFIRFSNSMGQHEETSTRSLPEKTAYRLLIAPIAKQTASQCINPSAQQNRSTIDDDLSSSYGPRDFLPEARRSKAGNS